ncbi:MAG: putrescine ABC transporter permease PotI, partial [Alphaproteobacteria bacterium]|nr:putrescine ABC transporter permease PotI [Alphaproteobacteria bacterium]
MNHRFESALANVILYGSMTAGLVFFYVPIFTLIAFSFQEGRFLTLPFDGISLKWYGALFQSGPALNALWNSTLIAVVATFVATIVGTMAAIVAVRYCFKGKRAFQGLAGAPLAFPQLLLGIVL